MYIYKYSNAYIYHSAGKRDREKDSQSEKDSQRAISYYTKFIQNSQNGHFQPSKKV